MLSRQVERKERLLRDVYSAIKKINASLYVNNINLRPMLGTGYTLEIMAWTLS